MTWTDPFVRIHKDCACAKSPNVGLEDDGALQTSRHVFLVYNVDHLNKKDFHLVAKTMEIHDDDSNDDDDKDEDTHCATD